MINEINDYTFNIKIIIYLKINNNAYMFFFLIFMFFIFNYHINDIKRESLRKL